MEYFHIESKDNSLIKHIVKLGQSANYRNNMSECVLHGLHLLEEAQKFSQLQSVIISQESSAKYKDFLNVLSGVKVYSVNTSVMHKLNLLDGQTDIVGVAKYSTAILETSLYNEDCLVLESIQDPGNLGTIMRVARACGIKNIILSSGCVDPYNPKVIRASQGIQFGLNIYTAVDLLSFLTEYKGLALATTPRAKQSIYTTDLTKPLAWVFGNEGLGITPQLLATILEHRSIPMAGDTESLNVAMAVTVCLFETYRQRLN